MKKLIIALTCLGSFATSVAFAQKAPAVIHAATFAKTATTFGSYWYRGLAEMNRFEVQQSRYGEMHEGELVAIFVTEDFLKTKQVKHDFGPKTDAVPIMKMLAYRHFSTGIYPYNLTTTAFVPVKEAKISKLSFSQTDWCGQVFSQFNRTDQGFNVESRSYFQSEGDKDFKIADAVLEDELWTKLRLNPKNLPTGTFDAVPSMAFLRLNHREAKVYTAKATTQEKVVRDFLKTPASAYTISFEDLGRTLILYYEPTFPFRIVAFEEIAPAIFNPQGGEPEVLTTRGVLAESIMLDYWKKHTNADAGYRKSLGLKPL